MRLQSKPVPLSSEGDPYGTLSALDILLGLAIHLLITSTTPPFPSANLTHLSGRPSDLLPLTTTALTILHPDRADILQSLTASDEDHAAHATSSPRLPPTLDPKSPFPSPSNLQGKHSSEVSSDDDIRQDCDRCIVE